MKSKIVLCCLAPAYEKQVLDEYLFYQIFKQYSIVRNVKVISSKNVAKAFIMLEDKTSMDQAILNLHNAVLNVGSLKVYESHKTSIVFDLSLQEILHKAYKEEGDGQESLFSSQDGRKRNMEFLIQKKASQKTVESWENINENDLFNNAQKPIERHFSGVKTNNQQSNLRKDNAYSHDYFYMGIGGDQKKKSVNEEFIIPDSFKLKKDTRFLKDPSKERTTMIRISNINAKTINFIAILNLYGCFGNVLRLLTDFQKNFIVIEFENPEQTRLAFKYTHRMLFFEIILKVDFFFEKSIFDELLINPVPHIKTRNNNPKFYRYKHSLKIKVNKPTKLLHFTNLPSKMTPFELYQQISQICDPVNIFKLTKKGATSDMFIVEFEKINESIEVLSLLHNKKIKSKLIKVSFSHAKVHKDS